MSDINKVFDLMSSSNSNAFPRGKYKLFSLEELLGTSGIFIKNAPFFKIPTYRLVFLLEEYKDKYSGDDNDLIKIVDDNYLSVIRSLETYNGCLYDTDNEYKIYAVIIDCPMTYLRLFLMLNDPNYFKRYSHSQNTDVDSYFRIFDFIKDKGIDMNCTLLTSRDRRNKNWIKIMEYGYSYSLFLERFQKDEKEVVLPVLIEKIKKCKTYLMKDNNTGLYKIGKSVNPKAREKTLQGEKPSIEMVWTTDCDIERDLHSKYSRQRVRGEWFNLNPIQVKYITKHY